MFQNKLIECWSITIKFSIKDTGVGISKKQLSEIYLAFNDNLNLLHTAKPTDENLRDERKSYNSLDSLMDSSEAEEFLQKSGVI